MNNANAEKELIELKIPDVGSTDKIELLEWKFGPGDTFEEGDELCDLVTDKASFALEAPSAGVLEEIKISNQSVVIPGDVAAVVRIAL